MSRRKILHLVMAVVMVFSLIVPVLTATAVTNIHNVTQDIYYDSIQEAVDTANDGDVIQLAAATYSESIVIDKALTLRGTSGAVIDADGEEFAITVTHSGVTLQGLTITGADDTATVKVDFTAAGFTAAALPSFTMNGCTLDGNTVTDSGVRFFGEIIDATINLTGNTVQDYYNWGFDLYSEVDFFDSSTINITGNTFTNIDSYGIDMDQPMIATTVNIANNFIEANNTGIYLDEIDADTTVTITGNTIEGECDGIYGSGVISGTIVITDNTIEVEYDGVEFNELIEEGSITIANNSISNAYNYSINFANYIVDSYVEISGNDIRSEDTQGINFYYRVTESYLIISGNTFETQFDAIKFYDYVENAFIVISDNTFESDFYGINFNYYMEPALIEISGNRFFDCQEGGIYFYDIYLNSGAVITVHNNYFAGEESAMVFRDISSIVIGTLELSFNSFAGITGTVISALEYDISVPLNWWDGPGVVSPGVDTAPYLSEVDFVGATGGSTGTTATVAAVLKDSNGDIADNNVLAVRFTVTGAHSFTRIVPMVDGSAVLEYTGSAVGADSITAEVLFAGLTAGLEASTSLTWEQGAGPGDDDGDPVLPPTSGGFGLYIALTFILMGCAVLLQKKASFKVQ